jgi:hypothetical protein
VKKRKHARIIQGLFAGFCLAFLAVDFGACSHDADNCYNTATCVYPSYCYEAGDAIDEFPDCVGLEPSQAETELMGDQ